MKKPHFNDYLVIDIYATYYSIVIWFYINLIKRKIRKKTRYDEWVGWTKNTGTLTSIVYVIKIYFHSQHKTYRFNPIYYHYITRITVLARSLSLSLSLINFHCWIIFRRKMSMILLEKKFTHLQLNTQSEETS